MTDPGKTKHGSAIWYQVLFFVPVLIK
jgi:hypothetical protein